MRRLLWVGSVLAVVIFSLFLLFSTFTVPLANARLLAEGPDLVEVQVPSQPASNPLLRPGGSLALQVNYGHDWVGGNTLPGATVALTITDGSGFKNSANVTADATGQFFAGCGAWAGGSCPQLALGDVVEGSALDLVETVGPLGSIEGELDAAQNLVTGTLNVPDLAGNTLDVRCEVWAEEGPPPIETVAGASGGTFTCDFGALAWDLEPGQTVGLTYLEPDGDSVINVLSFPWMRVRYGEGSGVEGNYEMGHTVWITVADDEGTVRATARTQSAPDAGWGGDGFAVAGDEWIPQQPLIVPGDLVYFRTDDGYTNVITVGTLTGNLDVDADSITGTILANWFSEPLAVECHPWGAPGPMNGRNSTAEPDGSTIYSCDWSGEWDVQPGQEIGVMYVEPDGDRVMTAFSEPAPYLTVDKQAGGEAGEGGNLAFYLNLANQGDADAENVVLTDTLVGMSYLADTSGLLAQVTTSPGEETVRWEVGTLRAGQADSFAVYVQVIEPAPNSITNSVLITTSNPYNQSGRDEWERLWQGHVAADDVEVNLGKDAWTGDPAPDTDLIFSLTPCNNGSTGSSRVTITDTLHPSMTVQSWWSSTPGWTEVSKTPGQLVLSHPTLNSYFCDELNVRVHLDGGAWPGMAVTNTATIFAANDDVPGNNGATWGANVNDPYTNLWIDKFWNGGQLVPGGELIYRIDYGNDGNLPIAATFRITDVVPVSTTFAEAWRDTPAGPEPFVPTLITDEYIVWEVDGLENGFSEGFDVRLHVDPDAVPGLTLANTAYMQSLPNERTYQDNQTQWIETLNPSGPNLRIWKQHNWHGDAQLYYEVYFENIGTDPLSQIVLTDTYPLSTTAANWPGWDYWRPITVTDNAVDNQWLFELEELQPGDRGRLWFDVDLEPALVGQPLHWFTNTVEIMIPVGDTNAADNAYQDVAFSGGEVQWVDVGVYDGHVWGHAPQGPVTVTTAYDQAILPGDFDWYFPEDFLPGDVLTVTAGAGLQPVVISIPTPYSATADGESNIVRGQVDSLDHEWLDVQIHGGATEVVQTDGAGNYLASFDDIPRGSYGEVRYQTTVDYADVTFHRNFRSQDLLLRAYHGAAQVEGDLPAGHTVWITVTNSADRVKGMAMTTSNPGDGWGGDGFRTEENLWQPEQPEILPGDWVYARTDDGKTSAVHVGEIAGTVDAGADRITGTVNDPLISPVALLDVECHTWGAPPDAPNPANKQSSALSDGNTPYACAWDPDSEWDLLPGQEIAVQYFEPDRDSVIAVFREAAPYLRLSKGIEGQPGEGGNLPFTIQYQNDGGADAENVVITDTLHGMHYLNDTSPFAVMTESVPGGELVTLYLDTVPAGTNVQFTLFTRIVSPSGSTISNTAVIATGSPYDQGEQWEKEGSWQGQVSDNDTHLNVGKWAWTGDPAPDTTFVYQVDVCNNGSTSSAGIFLTDTLPSLLTPVSWRADEDGWLELASDPRRLVLYQPSLSSFRCSTVYIDAHLDGSASVGTMISNTATISAANDLETDDNTASWEGTVSAPYTNLSAGKWWQSGVLVPGGRLVYSLRVDNNGNQPVADTIRMTDTLPVSTTFSSAWRNDDWGNRHPVTPTLVSGNQVVWEVAGLNNGFSNEFMVELYLESGAEPGTLLTNRLDVDSPAPEANVDDNVSFVFEEVYPAGPNLRLNKEGGWSDWGESTRQASYQLRVENVGDTPVFSPTITDTYPSSMIMDGDVGTDWGRWWAWGDDSANKQVTVTLDALYPGEVGWIYLNAIVPGDGPLPFGEVYTNTAEVTRVPAEVNPADNGETLVLSSGPDLYVEKTLIAGEGRPGEVVTFSLGFSNYRQGHEWWWNMQGMARLTDTLPAGMSYLTSTLRFCGEGAWCGFPPTTVEGNDLTWDLWPLASGEWNEIYLTVRLTDTITGSLFLTNRVEIASNEPLIDIEGINTNNSAERALTVAYPPHFDSLTVQDDSDLFLTWLADRAYASGGYQVWRADSPYFQPQVSEAMMIASGTLLHTTDVGIVGDGQNSYYLLVGVDDEGARHWAGYAGVFEFALEPGSN